MQPKGELFHNYLERPVEEMQREAIIAEEICTAIAILETVSLIPSRVPRTDRNALDGVYEHMDDYAFTKFYNDEASKKTYAPHDSYDTGNFTIRTRLTQFTASLDSNGSQRPNTMYQVFGLELTATRVLAEDFEQAAARIFVVRDKRTDAIQMFGITDNPDEAERSKKPLVAIPLTIEQREEVVKEFKAAQSANILT
jgi:hypothetical protein